MRELFSSLANSVTERFNEIKLQNNEVQNSLQFMSDKYDSLLLKLQTMEDDRVKDKRTIVLLEEKIESLERKIKTTGLEIRNIPRSTTDSKRAESKIDMSSLVLTLAKSVDIDLQESDIKDIYRINSSKESVKPIIVELNSVIKKESLLHAVKAFNKAKSSDCKLNTQHIKIPGPPQPIYVSETLTYKTQKLFYLAREFQRQNGYKFCWTSRGSVFLRQTEGGPLIRIHNELDLAKLGNTA